MSQSLCFQSVEFDVIQQNQQPWIRGYQIGTALGYGENADVSIRKLYTRHADEFTCAMTAVVTLPTEGGPQETRIFSLRGCHLLAMFARTPVAKQFRRWVLDVIEQYGDRMPVEQPVSIDATRPSRRTDPERKALTAIINTWVGMAPIHYASARAQVNAHFGVASVDALTVAQVRDAIQWVQAKIDALPPTNVESSVVASSPDFPTDMEPGRKDALRKIRAIMDSMEAARSVVSMFCYPAQRTMDMPRARRLSYDAQHDFYAAALDCLSAAHAALEAGYMLGRSGRRG